MTYFYDRGRDLDMNPNFHAFYVCAFKKLRRQLLELKKDLRESLWLVANLFFFTHFFLILHNNLLDALRWRVVNLRRSFCEFLICSNFKVLDFSERGSDYKLHCLILTFKITVCGTPHTSGINL